MNSLIIKNSKSIEEQGTPLIKCLSICEKNEILEVVSVNTGIRAKIRLANLGIVPGAKIIKKKSAPLKGPLEIEIRGFKLVIGRGIASKILVKCGIDCKVK